ncbi:transketolase [Congregibacter litoralis]|nr:transketolase [Congregibacter litoralis]
MNSQSLALSVREQSLRMVHRARASHIGSALSIADILAVLYARVLRFDPAQPAAPDRDRFVLSKGHACVALYAALAEIGCFPVKELDEYGQDFSRLMNHVSHHVPGVEFSTGSLGHGLPFAAGKALAGKIAKQPWQVFVLLSDGEMDEGSNWEALMFAAHHGLDNLTAIIDYNKLQSLDTVDNTLGLEPLREKLAAFNWSVVEADGHDHDALESAIGSGSPGLPLVVIAHTVKGKGVSFMENEVLWHYRNPDDGLLDRALKDIAGSQRDA